MRDAFPRSSPDPTLRPVVNELSARGDSNRATEEEGEELLAAWSQEFGEDFIPAAGNTFVAFRELYEGSTTVPTLRKLKSNYEESIAKARRAAGDFNALISRLEDECVQWYAEATAVFPAGTTNGDLIRGQIPTSTQLRRGFSDVCGSPSGGCRVRRRARRRGEGTNVRREFRLVLILNALTVRG